MRFSPVGKLDLRGRQAGGKVYEVQGERGKGKGECEESTTHFKGTNDAETLSASSGL